MRDWSALHRNIGPLRYQSSDSDCVPTTVINALSVLFEKRLHPKLCQLIWALSVDREGIKGTGWVCCDALATFLSKWFERAHQDGYAKESLPYTSRILEGESVHLGPGNAVLRCLNSGGVACVATEDHYYLLLDANRDEFLGFDCWWDKHKSRTIEEFSEYKGLVNTRWSRKDLEQVLGNGRWVHLIGRGA